MKQFVCIALLFALLNKVKSTGLCPQSNGLFANPSDPGCSSFLHCMDGISILNHCPPGLVFNPETTNCVLSSTYPCPGLRTPSNPCINPLGYYANSEDLLCKSFIQCSWGTPYVIQCPNGLVFDPSR